MATAVAIEVATAVAIETPALAPIPAAGDGPVAKPAKVLKAKSPKEKKASVAKKPALHPTYLEMISDAITALKERTGSSQYAISKFVEDKHKAHLPANFKKLLLVQLRKLTAAGKLIKVKNSYKISAKPSVAKKPALHPTYLEMISDAITALKERTGSSQYAISKFIEDKHKAHLPANFKKLLLVQLRKLTAAGKLIKVKNPYKISAKPSPTVKPKSTTAAKVKSAAAKLETTDAKVKKAAVKPKAKPAAPKTGAKSKGAVPKPKIADRQVKDAKTSAKATSGKKPAPTSVKKPKMLKSGKKALVEK